MLGLLLIFLLLSLLLGLDCEHLSFAVFVKHLQHQVGEFNDVKQEFLVVLLVIEEFEGELGDDAQIVVEYIGLQNLGVSLVLLIVAGGHVSDDVQELNQELESTVELLVLHLFVLLLLLDFDLVVHLSVQEFKVLKLQAGPDVVDVYLEGDFGHLHLRCLF